MGPMSAGQPSALRLRCSDGAVAWGISAGNACVRCVLPVHSSVLPALSGPHYSITAGEGSEPAEERQEACGPQGGPTSAAVLRCWACIELRRRFSLSVVRPLWGRRWWIHLSAGSLCSPAEERQEACGPQGGPTSAAVLRRALRCAGRSSSPLHSCHR